MTDTATVEAPETEADSPEDIDLDKFKEEVETVAEADQQKAKDQAKADKASKTPPKESKGAEDQTTEEDSKPPEDSKADEWKPTRQTIRLAGQLGYTEEEIADLIEEDAGPIERAARKHSQKLSEHGRALAEAEKAKAAADAGDEGSSRHGTEDDFVEDDLFSAEGVPFPAIGKLNIMRAETADINERLEILEGRDKRRENAQTDKTVEEFWASLEGDAYKQFGEGVTVDLIEGSPERELRAKLIEKAGEIRAGHASVNDGEMDLGESLQQALLILASEEITRAAEQEGEKRGARKKRHKQRSGGPTQRATTPPEYATPEAAAAAEIERQATALHIKLD